MDDQRLTDDTILQRTAAGQREALLHGVPLDGAQRRLLLLVNGYTPLRGLADRLPPGDDLHARVRPLIDGGLVAALGVERALA